MSSYTCRIGGCQDSFDTWNGRNSHEGQIHGGITHKFNCNNCGEEFERENPKKDKKDGRFCKSDCYYEYLREKTNVELECKECGNKFIVKKFQAEDRQFCRKSCAVEWQKRHHVGKNHGNYKGGSKKYYGPNWKEARKQTIEEKGDYCLNCGMSRKEHRKKFNIDLHIDHIKPLKKCIKEGMSYEEANSIDNLRPLCVSCHQRLENSYN